MLRTKFKMILLPMTIVPLLIVSGLMLWQLVFDLERQYENHLQNVLDLKQSQQVQNLNLIGASLESLARTAVLRNFLTANSIDEVHLPTTDLEKQAHDLMLSYQETMWGKLHHVFIANPNGHVILSPNHGDQKHAHLGQDVSSSPYFKPAFKQSVITDFFGFIEVDHFHQLYMVPIKDQDNKTLGVIVAEITISEQLKMLKEDVKMGEHGRVFMTTTDGTPIVHFTEDKANSLKHLPIKQVLEHSNFKKIQENENGIRVLGVYLNKPNLPWILGVEIEFNEILSIIYKQIYWPVVIIIILGIAGIFLADKVAVMVTTPIIKIAEGLRYLGRKNLGYRVSRDLLKRDDELGMMATSYQQTVSDLTQVVKNIASDSKEILQVSQKQSKDAEVIKDSSHHITEQTNSVSAASEQITANMNTVVSSNLQASTNIRQISHYTADISKEISNLASSFKQFSQSLTSISDNAQSNRMLTDQVYQSMQESSEKMDQLQTATQKIDNLLGQIHDIAGQTRMLALNATIEAASAGESGKGFAVVAAEVKNLANQATSFNGAIVEEINQIQSTVTDTNSTISEMTEVVQELNQNNSDNSETLKSESNRFNQMVQNMEGVRNSANETSKNVEEAVNGLQEIARSTEELSTGIQEVNTSIRGIKSDVNNINDKINVFNQQAQELNRIAQALDRQSSEFEY